MEGGRRERGGRERGGRERGERKEGGGRGAANGAWCIAQEILCARTSLLLKVGLTGEVGGAGEKLVPP